MFDPRIALVQVREKYAELAKEAVSNNWVHSRIMSGAKNISKDTTNFEGLPRALQNAKARNAVDTSKLKAHLADFAPHMEEGHVHPLTNRLAKRETLNSALDAASLESKVRPRQYDAHPQPLAKNYKKKTGY